MIHSQPRWLYFYGEQARSDALGMEYCNKGDSVSIYRDCALDYFQSIFVYLLMERKAIY